MNLPFQFMPYKRYRDRWVMSQMFTLATSIVSIKNKLSKKKLTVKDKQFIQDLLENVYIRSEFMDSDTKEVVEFKKAEIADFIKNLKK